VFASDQDMSQEDSSRWNLSGLGDCPLCMESVINLSLVLSIVSEGGLKKLQLIFLKTVPVTQSSGRVNRERDLHACGKGVVWVSGELAVYP
jgi:hypothetical protein